MRDSNVLNSCNIVLLGYSSEGAQVSEVVAGLGLEDLAKVFLSFVKFWEGRSLVHSILSNSAPASEDNVQITDRVVEKLHLVEDVVAIDSVLEVYLGQVAIPRLLALAEHSVRLFKVAR